MVCRSRELLGYICLGKVSLCSVVGKLGQVHGKYNVLYEHIRMYLNVFCGLNVMQAWWSSITRDRLGKT